MTFKANIIADSVGPLGTRLTTWSLLYPRFIHAEIMTHRMFSRNASSSRAIPVLKQLARIVEDPAMPVEWGVNQPGMQASEILTPDQEAQARAVWLDVRDYAVRGSRKLAELNVHKQIANRIAEPWSHIAVVLSGTEFANYFSLRHHPAAQPEFRALAALMAPLYRESAPRVLQPGEWHLPYVTDAERGQHPVADLIKFSVARCARVSYLNHDGTAPNCSSDLQLYARLAEGRPLHASPTEHQATPFYDAYAHGDVGVHAALIESTPRWAYPYDKKWGDKVPWSGNFRGFFQYRQSLAGQNETTFPWEK